jgi:hypothetical protein
MYLYISRYIGSTWFITTRTDLTRCGDEIGSSSSTGSALGWEEGRGGGAAVVTGVAGRGMGVAWHGMAWARQCTVQCSTVDTVTCTDDDDDDVWRNVDTVSSFGVTVDVRGDGEWIGSVSFGVSVRIVGNSGVGM